MPTPFELYCTAQGRTKPAQLAHDTDLYPGGKMCGFIIWWGHRLAWYRKAFNVHPYDYLLPAQVDELIEITQNEITGIEKPG